ncbi:ABC transporter substrate-binding protein [Luteimonas sp. BDR2-5]|uniref:ABC transporter substrate-binding protein n=1 Tax=Proluteimonas luteida TaxID=2878685 RepID=UPI001E42022C|nr:ABC transporter substrate-binding protein [Luteimonas sp. BDR2-5]MCD9028573.1 ABC transporter substrate-binding protein [Luteimonas sp. BDR2-5]
MCNAQCGGTCDRSHPWLARTLLLAASVLVAVGLAACGPGSTDVGDRAVSDSGGIAIPLRYARYLELVRHEGFIVARLQAPVADQGGARAPQSDTLVLVPEADEAPALTGALRGATIVRTPVRTIAANNGVDEAFLSALGVADRLVAVGGLTSFDNTTRRRAKAGEIAQVGYNWHAPPNLDVLIARQPDVFLMRLSDLAQTPVLQRARALGLTVVPTFAEEETSYLGRAEWIRFFGLLTGTDARAQALFDEIEGNVAALKAQVADQPSPGVLWAYPAGADRWVATVRGAEAAYIADAGGINLMAQPEDPARWSSETVSSEALLPLAARTDLWLIGDLHAAPPRGRAVLDAFPAWREGRLYGNTGRSLLDENVHDWYQTAVVRPDWVLGDFVKMLHPQLRPEPFRFLKPLPQDRYQ